MMEKISRKLRGKTGESIGETLIALLISSLALMMLAGAVSSAGTIVQKSKAAFNDYYTKNNAVADQTAPAGTLNVTFSSEPDESELPFKPASSVVNYYINDKYKQFQVVSYEMVPEPESSFTGGDGGGTP